MGDFGRRVTTKRMVRRKVERPIGAAAGKAAVGRVEGQSKSRRRGAAEEIEVRGGGRGERAAEGSRQEGGRGRTIA